MRRLKLTNFHSDFFLQDVVGSCEDMLGIWLEGREGGRRPLTWTSLLEALKETGEFATLAASIESGISHC